METPETAAPVRAPGGADEAHKFDAQGKPRSWRQVPGNAGPSYLSQSEYEDELAAKKN